jgi:hypothetical protein
MRVARARSTLASNTVISFEALAVTSGAVTATLVGALHVVVGSVRKRLEIRILHLRELLGGAIRVSEVVVNDDVVGVVH